MGDVIWCTLGVLNTSIQCGKCIRAIVEIRIYYIIWLSKTQVRDLWPLEGASQSWGDLFPEPPAPASGASKQVKLRAKRSRGRVLRAVCDKIAPKSHGMLAVTAFPGGVPSHMKRVARPPPTVCSRHCLQSALSAVGTVCSRRGRQRPTPGLPTLNVRRPRGFAIHHRREDPG